MTYYRVVNPINTYLNDGSTIGDIPRTELDVLWAGEQFPDEGTIDELKANLLPTQLRHLFTEDVLWEGEGYPSYLESTEAARRARPASDFMARYYPSANVKDVSRAPELKIQKQRVIRQLGWKTLSRVGLVFGSEE